MGQRLALVLIPARYASSRFPGKPLAKIDGKSMIQRVYENCLDANSESGENSSSSNLKEGAKNPLWKFVPWIVTDSQEIEKHVKDFGGNACRVDDDTQSGTERIYLAFQRYFQDQNFNLVINVQGDEPLLLGEELNRLAKFHDTTSFPITTIVKKRAGQKEKLSPHIVKVMYSEITNRCQYFSRSAIPHDLRGDDTSSWFQHIGIYSYKVTALESFCGHGPSSWEKSESLEQLRALELGMEIGGIETKLNLIGVDIPDDIKKVEGVLRGETVL